MVEEPPATVFFKKKGKTKTDRLFQRELSCVSSKHAELISHLMTQSKLATEKTVSPFSVLGSVLWVPLSRSTLSLTADHPTYNG